MCEHSARHDIGKRRFFERLCLQRDNRAIGSKTFQKIYTMSLTVRIVTFNYGDVSHTQSEWNRFVHDPSSVWHKFLFGRDNMLSKADVYAIALQEVPRSSRTVLGRVLAETLGVGYRYMYERNEAFGDFGVELHLIVSPSVYLAPQEDTSGGQQKDFLAWTETRVVAHNPFLAQQIASAFVGKSTKATVGAAFDACVNANEERLRFLFLSSHLPVDTKEPISFGLKARVEAIMQAEREVVQPLLSKGPDRAVVFWAGDFNFRHEPKNSVVHPTDVEQFVPNDYVDQLDRLLAQQKNIPGRYYEAATPRLFSPTCKYIVEKRAKDQRSMNVVPRQYKNTRIPSYCDRIIYRVVDTNGQEVSVQNENYDDMYEPMSMQQSDHAAVYAEFSVSVQQ